MANETRKEIQSLLEDDKSISTRVGTRLTLSMLAEMADELQQMREEWNELKGRIDALEAVQKEIKRNDFVEWVRGNTKTFVAVFIIAVVLIDEFKDYLIAAAKKWLGLP